MEDRQGNFHRQNWMSRLLSGDGIAVFRDSLGRSPLGRGWEENLCVSRRLETMRSMKWPAGKLNEWFSSRGAPLNNLPVALLSSFLPP